MHIGFSKQRTHEPGQPHPQARLAAPATEIEARQHNLRIALCESADLVDDLRHRRASASAAHRRNDAERAAVRTAILNLQILPATVACRTFDRSRHELSGT